MAKKLLMNKVNNVIDNYNRWLQVFEFSKSFNIINDSRIDEEGKLYIDEIWGNTWQDNGSKNLFDKNQEITVGLLLGNGVIDTNPNRVDYSTSDYIQIKPLTTYAIRLGTFDNRVGFYDKDKEFIDIDTFRNSNTFTTPQNCVYIRTSCLHMFENVQLNEGSVLLEYDEYRKSDLSNIQHVGELYVDEEGKKQYKIDINVNNGVLWEGEYNCRVDPNWATSDLNDGIGGYGASDYIEIEGGIILEQTWRIHMFFFDKDKKGISNTKDRIFTTPKNTKYVRMAEHNCYGQKTDALLRIKGVDDTVKKSHQQTILLPCQLMKVGDVKDRLYWDVDKGRYMVEKNIISFLATNTTRGILDESDYITFRRLNNIQAMYVDKRIDIIDSNIYNAPIVQSKDWVNIQVKKNFYCEQGYKVTDSDATRFLKDYPVNIFTPLLKPGLIETNITERIELPCYTPITCMIVNSGNVEPSNVKAFVPMKTLKGVITDGLICWLDGRDGKSQDVTWKDRSEKGSDAILKQFTFDGSNGWTGSSLLFNGRNYCEIKNLDTIEGNNRTFEFEFYDNPAQTKGFLSNRTKYNDGFSILQQNDCLTLDINYNNIQQREYIFDVKFSGVITVSINKSGETKFYKNGVYQETKHYNTLNSSFPYNTSTWRLGGFRNSEEGIKGKISFVRIYNRVLTEEEIRQNYLYEQSIERG